MTQTTAEASSRERGILALILVCAFSLRAAYAFLWNAELPDLPNFDGHWYNRVARDLLEGKGMRSIEGNPTAFFPPGYPAILALFYGIFGKTLIVARLLNCALATLTCVLTYAIGKKIYGARIGLIAAAILAFLPDDIGYASLTLSEATFSAAFTACIWLFQRWNCENAPLVRWLVFGVLLGLAALIRGVALFWASVPALIWWLQPSTRRLGYSRTALIGLGLVITIAPWTIRNQIQLGAPILIASDGPMALLIAHSPMADGSQSIEHWYLRAAHPNPNKDGSPLKEADAARADQAYAIRYMLTHPLHELQLIPLRLYHLFKDGHYSISFSTVSDVDPRTGAARTRLRQPHEYSGVARFADGVYFLLLALAAWGLVRALQSRNEFGWLVPMTLIFFLGIHGILFWGDPRFHAPFAPMLTILAASAIEGFYQRARAGI